jgi:putative tryptophan/tyrosine transport system substrate-binding protein
VKRFPILDLGFSIERARTAKIICLALCVLLLAPGVSAEAQQQTKLLKIGWLDSGPTVRGTRLGELFLHRLHELGYVESNNVTIEYRAANNQLERLPSLAGELVRLNVGVLVTSTTPAAIAAKNATKTIPIVFILLAADPVAAGLVDSLARPGGNITGITNIAAELGGKRLELLKETVPKLTRVALLWDPQNSGSVQAWKESQTPARELGLQLHSMEVSSADKFEGAFNDAIKARSTAIAVTPTILATSHRKQIVELAAKTRLPAIYAREEFVESGGLMSYGADLDDHYRRAAIYVDKILKGAKPADLPVEQPTKFELIINLKAAKQIVLTIPPNVLARADRVIR